MILPKFFSIAITLLLLLLFVTLIDSTKFECLTTFSSLTNSKYDANKERYLILLDQTTVTTTAINSSEKLTSIEHHLGFLESCWGIGSESVLYEGVSTAKLISQNNVLHFSVGEISGYSGLFNDLFINEQIKPLPNVRIIEKVVKGKGGAVQNQPSHNLDRIDQRNFPLDGKYKYPNQAGRGVDVFVLDSGIDVKNAEFEHRATFGAVFCSGCPARDDHGHGTAVASIVGGKTFGVAKKVRLVAVKVLNSQDEVFSDELVFGMAYVLNEHLKKKSRNTVVNISLQFTFISDAINSFVKELTDAGIHVVVIAGNFATDACKVSPAAAPSAITVGATEFFNDSITDFSDFGSCVDIFAPGRNVSLLWGGNPSYPTHDYFGTSFASPAVAGAVALRISVTGNTSPSKMTRIIFNESTKNVVTNLPPNTPNRFLFVPSH